MLLQKRPGHLSSNPRRTIFPPQLLCWKVDCEYDRTIVLRQGIKWFQVVSVSKGCMDNRSIRRRECARCWILSRGLLRVIEKCIVRIHDSVYKIFAFRIGISCLFPGRVLGVDVCADHLVYFGIWLEPGQCYTGCL